MTRITTLILAVVLVAGITLASGLMQGRMSERWGTTGNLPELAKKMQEVSEEFGDWRLTNSEELGEGPAKQLEAVGHFVRVYVNDVTGQQVRVALVLGPSGPMSVHIPEICYSGRDYLPREERERITVPVTEQTDAKLWSVVLDSQGLEGQSLYVCYGWSQGDRWQAPEQPRFSLAGSPYLYKLQLASEGTLTEISDDTNACVEFLKTFLPALESHLVAPSTE